MPTFPAATGAGCERIARAPPRVHRPRAWYGCAAGAGFLPPPPARPRREYTALSAAARDAGGRLPFVLNHIGVLVSATGFALGFEFDVNKSPMIVMILLDMVMAAIGLIFAGGTIIWNFCGFLYRSCKCQTDKGGHCCGIICCAFWVCVAELALFYWGLNCGARTLPGNLPGARRASVALSHATCPTRPGINMSAQYDPNNNERWKHVADATCAGWSPQSWEQGDTDPTGTASCLNATHRCEPVDADKIGKRAGTCTPGGGEVECWEYTPTRSSSASAPSSRSSVSCARIATSAALKRRDHPLRRLVVPRWQLHGHEQHPLPPSPHSLPNLCLRMRCPRITAYVVIKLSAVKYRALFS